MQNTKYPITFKVMTTLIMAN